MIRIIATFILFLVLVSSVSFAQESKTFYLKSGDKITGVVIEETETTYILETTFGAVTIQKIDIQPEEVEIFLKSGDRLQGILLEETETGLNVKTSFGELFIDADKIEQFEFKTKAGLEVETAIEPDRWYFSDERLMDIWFDPTGFTLRKSEFYISLLSWAFGLNDRLQISTKWVNYFWGDFNIRPKFTLFEKGDYKSLSAFSIGGHIHSRGLPGKYKWVENAEWEVNQQADTVYFDGWVLVPEKLDEYGDYSSDEDRPWLEVFSSYSVSKLRSSGQGRIGYTVGASAVYYPNEEIMPRVYAGMDIDVLKNVKVMAEIFYDPYYVSWYKLMEDEKENIFLFFDIGFMTNSLPLFGMKSEKLWIGIHFHQPFFSVYYKF